MLVGLLTPRATGAVALGMRGAVSPRMHEVSFAVKRAYWRAQRFLRPLAERHGLTPSRFEVLLAAHRMKGDAYQSRIARMLGVRRSTVCKMMTAMEKLGLLVRLDYNVYDRRLRRWKLTAKGVACYEALMKLIREGTVARILYQCLMIRERLSGEDAEGVLDNAIDVARRLTRSWGDRATLYDFAAPGRGLAAKFR